MTVYIYASARAVAANATPFQNCKQLESEPNRFALKSAALATSIDGTITAPIHWAPISRNVNYWEDNGHELASTVHLAKDTAPPLLGTVSASTRSRKPSKKADFLASQKSGNIVLNPMRASKLSISDRHLPLTSSLTRRYVNICVRPEQGSKVCSNVPNNLVPVDDLYYPDYQVPPPTGLRAGTYAQLTYFQLNGNQVTSLFRKTGLSAGADSLLNFLDQEVRSVPRNSELITRARAELRSGTYDLLTDIGESKSTIQLVISLVTRILSLFLRKKAVTKLWSKADSDKIASAWLEFRYGIMPLVYSLNDALALLQHQKFIEYVSVRKSDVSPLLIEWRGFTAQLDVRHRVFGKAHVNGPTAGLKLNPLTTALELVPLSLLLNWVCNIGDVLSALWPPQGASEERYTYSIQVPQGTYKLVSPEGVEIPFTYSLYDTSILTEFPVFALRLSNNMTLKRIIDAFALTWAPLRRRVST